MIVPLNWRLSPPELAAILADAEAPLLIADAAYADVAGELVAARSAGRADRARATTTSRGWPRTRRSIRVSAASPAT